MNQLRILIAPDKFKGSLPARAVATALAAGLRSGHPSFGIAIHPLADGGDGSTAILADLLAWTRVEVPTVDAALRPLQAAYYHDGETAYLELAAAAGLAPLPQKLRDPLRTSTYGLGLLAADAVRRGISRQVFFLGGSATHDLGLGVARAFGFRFLSAEGADLVPTGGELAHIAQIVPPREGLPSGLRVELLCDVDNPLLGPKGAARVYASQKGADSVGVELLEIGCRSSNVLLRAYAEDNDLPGAGAADLPGAGAAGGVGAGLIPLMGAELRPGFATIAELSGLDDALDQADLVISGEGQLDGQSLNGKVVDGLRQKCQARNLPLHLVVGHCALPETRWRAAGISSVRAITDLAPDTQRAMQEAEIYLRRLGADLATSLVSEKG